MFAGVGLLLVLGIVVGIVVAVVHATSSATSTRGAAVPQAAPADLSTLDADLARWSAQGLISAEQAADILESERARRLLPPPPVATAPATIVPDRPRRVPVVAEALGYLGGTLGIVGLILIVSRYWPDLSTTGRLLLSGIGALALWGAGTLVRDQTEPALVRLRAFLWLLSSAATGLFAVVAARNGLGLERDAAVVASCAGLVTVHAAALWRWRERPAQQAVALAGLATFVGALLVDPSSTGVAGLAVWAVGTGYVLLALSRRGPSPLLTEALGAVAMLVGANMIGADRPGIGQPFAVVSAGCLVALVMVPQFRTRRPDRVVLAALGGLALLMSVPPTIGYFAEGAGAATGGVTWALGALLILVGAKRLVRLPVLAETAGCVALLVGAAVTATQWHSAAPLLGLATAVALVALGMLPGRVLLSLFGTLGLLVNVPWAIARFFPGEGRAPLMILVSGMLLVAVSVVLARMGGRFRHELGGPPKGVAGPAPGPA